METVDIELEAAKEKAREAARLEEKRLAQTYHMGQKPTLGKDYDDRLTTRLGIGSTTAYLYLGLPEHRGGIPHRRFGKKYHITERSLQVWEGDRQAKAA